METGENTVKTVEIDELGQSKTIILHSDPNVTVRKPGNPNWKKGVSANPGGRPTNGTARSTETMRQHWLTVFDELQEDENFNLSAFAKTNPKDFYLAAMKLIPTAIKQELSGTLGLYQAVEIPVQLRESDESDVIVDLKIQQ